MRKWVIATFREKIEKKLNSCKIAFVQLKNRKSWQNYTTGCNLQMQNNKNNLF